MKYLNENINLGGCLKYKGNNYEVTIEKDKFNSIAYAFDNSNEIELTQALEKSVLKIIDNLDLGLVKIHLFDFDVNRKFQHLNQLKNVNGLINYVNTKNIKDTIDELENTVIDYHNNYLTNEYTDICEYNKNNTDFPLKYNIIIINYDYLEINNEYYLALTKLLKNGRKAGIIFYHLFNGKVFASEIAKGREKHTYNNKQKVEFYELILQKSIAIFKANGKYKIKKSNSQLQDAFNRFMYSPFCNDIDNILSSIMDKQMVIEKNNETYNFLSVPIGRKGRQTYYFELGLKSASYHAFIGGDTGMGKSNFINNLIVQIAENYSPDDIRLTLLDLKGGGGTEFQFYKEHPNVETLVLTSKLDVVEKVIKDFTEELNTRTKLFNDNEVKNVEEYRKKTGKKLPYKLMIIDEVQVLFASDWKTSKIFNSLLDKIGRQGRSYGLHMILSTQSLSDVDISNSILNQLKLRISFKLSNLNDCRKIMDARGNNELPYDIEPYEVVYNNNLGKPEANQHFLTTEIKTDTIKERIKNSKQKATLKFSKKIYTFDSELTSSGSKKKDNDDYLKFTSKGEVNLDDY